MLRIIFLLLFPYLLFAIPTISINSKEFSITNFSLEYYVDKTETKTLDEVFDEEFQVDKNTLSIGREKNHAWIRFKVKNTSKEKINLYLHNELAYLNLNLDFYTLSNEKIVDSLHIDIANPQETKTKLYGTDAVYLISLDRDETKTIYIKNTMTIIQTLYLTLHDQKSSKKSLTGKYSILLILLGMLIALSLYHAMLYISTGYKEYIFYTLYLASAVIWEAQLTGILAIELNHYPVPENGKLLLSALLVPIFLSLFAKTIFNTKKQYPIENFFLDSIIFLFSIAFIIGLFSTQTGLKLAPELFVYLFIVLLGSTYSIMKKGNKLAAIFLIGNSLFAFFTLITDLSYSGFLEYNSFYFNAAIIGILIEAIVLAFMLSYRFKTLQKNDLIKAERIAQQDKIEAMNKTLQKRIDEEVNASREKDKIVFQQTKKASMGEMIENIAHQWRQPLAEVNASVVVIDNIIYEKYEDDEDIQKELHSIETLTAYMSKTIDSFREFFDDHKNLSCFSLSDSIENTLAIVKKSFSDNKIQMNINVDSEFIIESYENELQQVFLILLNNAKDAFISKKTPNPQISIDVQLFSDKYRISICDNAGGIDYAIIDKIFDPYFTTKHKAQGTGLGLYMSKVIIEDNMNGKINVKNNFNGACFNIILNQKLVHD